VIIVAVTIAVAIAVAFWMTGIIGLFTGAVEKLEIVSATATAADNNQWTITIVARNTGTTQTSVDVIFVNGYNATQLWCGNQQVTVNPPLPQVIRPGEQMRFTININAGACQVDNNNNPVFTANPGVSIEVKLHTTGGKEYPKLLTLP
jgi:hypothetical protein